ncbi:MAG: nucleotidyltransferase [Candidatus Edwardsbacteria bacterium]
MSPDEIILLRILKELKGARLETILVGNTACALQGVPVMTQDIDFFVRDTVLNRKKIARFAKGLKLFISKSNNAVGETIRTENKEIVVDFVFRLGPKQTFNNVRSRSQLIKIGNLFCRVASLEDLYLAKSCLGREKDKALLKIIKDTIRVKNIFTKER